MALPQELNSWWLHQTIHSLDRFNYDYVVVESVDGNTSFGKRRFQSMRTKISHPNVGQLGCWTSHLEAWARSAMLRRPIISVEADTYAIAPWKDIDENIYKHDIIFLHDHARRPVHCTSNKSSLKYGIGNWFATGALLFTGNTQLSVILEKYLNQPTPYPIGHWLNHAYHKRELRIGSLCPSLFFQVSRNKPSHISPLQMTHLEPSS